MRPLNLRMQAFGPFQGEETIDFAELGANRLFLIHGETGAGKTSILDAIVFALYGDTSGGERQGAQMRCESASTSLPTEVTYDFALGERRFRVHRRPKQDLASQRGPGGLVTKQADATLWETTDAAPGTEGKLLASKIRDVTEQVRGLLGFSSEQFRQVVMLPQGKFRDVLAAGSDKREEILRQLFKTDQYAALERRLWERARDVAKKREELSITRNAWLSQAGATSDAELLALTEEAVGFARAAGKEAKKAEKAQKEAASRLKAAEDADAAQLALAEAQRRWDLLMKRKLEIAELQAGVTAGRKAEKVRPAAEGDELADEELSSSVSDAEDAREALEEAKANEKMASKALAAEEKRAPQRTVADDTVRKLTEMQGLAAEWQDAEKSRKAAEQDMHAAEAALQDARDRLDKAKSLLEGAIERSAQAVSAATALEAAKLRRQEAERILEHVRALEDAKKAYKATQDVSSKARGVETEARERLKVAEERQAKVETSWRAGRAAALAQSLVDGEACPVCGSTKHPTLAVSATTVDDEELDAARDHVDRARSSLDEASRVLNDAETGVSAAQACVGVRNADVDPLMTATKAEKALAWSDKECDSFKTLLASLGDPAEIVARAKEQLDNEQKSLSSAEKQEKASSATFVAARTRSEGLAKRVPAELRGAGIIDRRLKVAEVALRQLEAALTTAQKANSEEREARIVADGELKAAVKAVAKARKAKTAASAAFVSALERVGFSDKSVYEEAMVSEKVLLEAEDEIATHHDALSEAKGSLAEAKKAALAHPRAGAVAELAPLSQQATDLAKEMLTALNHADGRVGTLHKVRDDLDGLDLRFAEFEARYRIIGVLSDVANGQGPGAKVSFQRWVLGSYLDSVLQAATTRLVDMSKGRYRLERQREATDMKRASGLDLAVFDGWSNRSRPAVTLSGGESFLAALALALGLAETVQAESGGTRLETIFIDEGFGALDPASLDLAMDALADLNVTGRLVGVISHVPELRQVIDARLEVTGGSGGSSTRFVVP